MVSLSSKSLTGQVGLIINTNAALKALVYAHLLFLAESISLIVNVPLFRNQWLLVLFLRL